MVLNPSIQRLAQEEIDRAIPDGRLPTLHDRPRLPYVEAVVREIMRRYPVLPLGMSSSSRSPPCARLTLILSGCASLVGGRRISRHASTEGGNSHSEHLVSMVSRARLHTHLFHRAILNNPEDYPDPQAFKPERYLRDGVLDSNAPNPYVVVFGYGRRFVL